MTHVHAGCKAGVGLRTKESPMASSGACKGPSAGIGRADGMLPGTRCEDVRRVALIR